MDGWVDGWIDGLIYECIDLWMDSWIYWWIDLWMDWWLDWWIDWWIDRWMDCFVNGLMVGWIDWLMDGLMACLMDGWVDRWIYCWIDGLIDKWKEGAERIQKDRLCVRIIQVDGESQNSEKDGRWEDIIGRRKMGRIYRGWEKRHGIYVRMDWWIDGWRNKKNISNIWVHLIPCTREHLQRH